MSTTTLTRTGNTLPRTGGTLARTWSEIRLLAGRALRHIPREPEKLMDVTVMPIIFILLFVYVFGSAIQIGGSAADYHSYLVSGMFALGMTSTLSGIAVGVAADLESGLIDRLRALPIARISVVAGNTVAELAQQALGLFVLVAVGLLVGWRANGSWAETLAAFALVMAWGFAVGWLGTFVGFVVRGPQAAQAFTMIVFFPVMFLSSVFVPVSGLPTPFRIIAEWNPISAVATAVRELFHNPLPPQPHVWPLEHPIPAVLLWCVGIIAVFAPLAVRSFRRMSER